MVEDYAHKMPFAFTDTLNKLLLVLEPMKLTDEERKRLLEEESARPSMSVSVVRSAPNAISKTPCGKHRVLLFCRFLGSKIPLVPE